MRGKGLPLLIANTSCFLLRQSPKLKIILLSPHQDHIHEHLHKLQYPAIRVHHYVSTLYMSKTLLVCFYVNMEFLDMKRQFHPCDIYFY